MITGSSSNGLLEAKLRRESMGGTWGADSLSRCHPKRENVQTQWRKLCEGSSFSERLVFPFRVGC